MNYEFNLLSHVGVVARRVCGGDGARRARQYPFRPNGPRGKKTIKNDGQSAIMDFISAKFVKGYQSVSPYILLSSMHGPDILLCFELRKYHKITQIKNGH